MASTLTDRINGVNGGVAQKVPVKCATTANIMLEGEQTIDGVSTSESYVLVKDQTDSSENGIWVTSTGLWTRRPDADGVRDLVRGSEVYITDGTVNGDTLWSLRASSDPIVPGTTEITFENFSNVITSGYLPVTLTSPASGEFVQYNGSAWVNYNLFVDDLTFSGNNSFSGSHTLSGDFAAPTGSELTVSSNTITFTRMNHPVGSGGASSVDVNTMAGGSDGAIFITTAADAAETINFKHAVDNVYIPTLTDISLDDTRRYVGWVYDAASTNYIALFDGTTKEYVDKKARVVQKKVVSDGAVATGTTQIPLDDTIPQNTEGDQYLTIAFTPKYATTRLKIDVVLCQSLSGAGTTTVALFRDSGADAIGASSLYIPATNAQAPISFSVDVASTAAALTNFYVRAGANSALTLTFNGAGGARFMGGVMSSSITVTEYFED